jgi:nucleotide-binding universal stress UspA family protein
MLEHLVVAVDLSPTGETLLPRPSGLRRLGARRVTLVHVAEVDYPMAGAVAHLDHHRTRLGEMGAEVATGDAARVILKAADREPGTLLIMGIRGRGFLGGPWLGKVTRRVLRETAVRTLVVPAKEEE